MMNPSLLPRDVRSGGTHLKQAIMPASRELESSTSLHLPSFLNEHLANEIL